MIRKAVIVFCLLATIGWGIGWQHSYSRSTSLGKQDDTERPAGTGWRAAWEVNAGRAIGISGRLGTVSFVVAEVSLRELPFTGWTTPDVAKRVAELAWQRGDYALYRRVIPGQCGVTLGRAWILSTPFWCPTAMCVSYPAITFIRGPVRRWRRRRRGLCAGCGYDLTGNVTGVCSECGVRI